MSNSKNAYTTYEPGTTPDSVAHMWFIITGKQLPHYAYSFNSTCWWNAIVVALFSHGKKLTTASANIMLDTLREHNGRFGSPFDQKTWAILNIHNIKCYEFVNGSVQTNRLDQPLGPNLPHVLFKHGSNHWHIAVATNLKVDLSGSPGVRVVAGTITVDTSTLDIPRFNYDYKSNTNGETKRAPAKAMPDAKNADAKRKELTGRINTIKSLIRDYKGSPGDGFILGLQQNLYEFLAMELNAEASEAVEVARLADIAEAADAKQVSGEAAEDIRRVKVFEAAEAKRVAEDIRQVEAYKADLTMASTMEAKFAPTHIGDSSALARRAASDEKLARELAGVTDTDATGIINAFKETVDNTEKAEKALRDKFSFRPYVPPSHRP